MRNLLFLIIFCAGLFFVFRQKPDRTATPSVEQPLVEPPKDAAPSEKTVDVKSTTNSIVGKKVRVDLGAAAPAPAAKADRPLAEQLNEAENLFPALSKSYSESNPKDVLKVGEAIDRAGRELDKDPSSLDTVGKFFESCVTSEVAPATLRALCWKRLSSLSEKFHYNIDAVGATVPTGIKKISAYQIN